MSGFSLLDGLGLSINMSCIQRIMLFIINLAIFAFEFASRTSA